MELAAQLELETLDPEEDLEDLATLLASGLHGLAPAGTADDDAGDSAHDQLKKRRLMKGAAESAQVFSACSSHMMNCNAIASLVTYVTWPQNEFNIPKRCEQLWTFVQGRHPAWDDSLVRLGAAAIANQEEPDGFVYVHW